MEMRLPSQKTKIVATIGPSSSSVKILERLIKAGMSVARLNLAHGTFEQHRKLISNIRTASARTGRRVGIMGDLPGVKIRVGNLVDGKMELRRNQTVTLTVRDVEGINGVVPVEFKDFPKLVSPGDVIYLSDGFIVLRVDRVSGTDVVCKVIVGGILYSKKGINVPKARIPLEAITQHDLDILEFLLEEDVDAVGISFVGSAYDVLKVRRFIEERKKYMFLVAKIERPDAIRNFEEILSATDGVMIARGDLGVETSMEKLPILQKRLISRAVMVGKPVIVATQMLESMTTEKLPTRAEVTDVANAILDGADAVMLSEETAVGKYPVETVRMMARIARTTESYREGFGETRMMEWKASLPKRGTIKDAITRSIIEALQVVDIKYIITPTKTGYTPRLIVRFRPKQWILAFTENEKVANALMFSYGVYPFVVDNDCEEVILEFIKGLGLVKEDDMVLLTKGAPIGKTVGTNTIRIFQIK